LERGLPILKAFTPRRTVLGIAEIVDELGMSRSTIHRYVTTFVALGYMEQTVDRKYRLGRVPRTQKEVDVERADGCHAT
jgi:DNA-binding IclR family transcriptional regulator